MSPPDCTQKLVYALRTLWYLGPSDLELLRNVFYGTCYSSVQVLLNRVCERTEPQTGEP